MYVRDLEGNEYLLQATTTLDKELNGNQQLSFTIKPTKVNNEFINDITEMWEVVDDTEYKIVYCKQKGEGKSLTVDVKAIPLFFDTFDTDRIYEEYNESMTDTEYFDLVFGGTDYNYVLLGTFYAQTWQGLGNGSTRLELFKRGLERYRAEFYIEGKTVYLDNQIGRDTQFMYRYRLNASNIIKEIDASKLYTYAKGFGDYASGEEQNANLIREYTSPLAQIIGIRHAPPIYNGKIKDPVFMDEQLETLVNDSLKISVSATIHDLRKQGYALAQPENGDRVFLIDERIGLNEEVRVQHMNIKRDWKGNILDLKLTLGSPGIVRRHQSNLQTAIKNITQLMEGKTKLPYSALDDAILIATEALRDTQTELSFNENGILATDKNDPNFVVLLNSAGLGVSTDGGATFENAITGHGINANLITVGTMLFDRIRGGTAVFGGMNNQNGVMEVYNSDGELIAILDGDQGGFDDLTITNLTVTENIEAPNIVKESSSNITYRVRGTQGSDDNTGIPDHSGDWENALYSIQEAIDRLPKFINGDVKIEISNNYDIEESVELKGFGGGGSITIDVRGSKLKGNFYFQSCNVKIYLENGEIDGTRLRIIENETSSFVWVRNMLINGNDTQESGIRTLQGGQTYISDCEIYNVDSCILVTSAGRAHVANCKGLGTDAGLYAVYSGVITGYGTAPMGEDRDTYEAIGGRIPSTFTHDSGSATPPAPPVVDVKQTWSANDGNNYSLDYNSWGSTNYNTPYQGRWDQWGPYKGCWFFGSGMRNTLNGKTIKRIRVKLNRASGSGNYSSVNAIIRMHQHASQPSGEPTMSNTTHSVGFKAGATKWFTLPSSFHSLFSNGSWYGLGIYHSSPSNSNYMRFTDMCEIEVTYEDVA